MTLSQQLRSLCKRLRETRYSSERAQIVAEGLPLLGKAADALDARHVEHKTTIDPDVAKLLGALGKGSQFPGRKYYVNRSAQFDAAVDALFKRYRFEEISLESK